MDRTLEKVDVAGLRAALEKATPGPWRVDRPSFLSGEPSGYVFGPETEMIADDCHECEGVRIRGVGGRLPMKANADLIVAAVNALPALLAAYEAQQEEIETLKAALAAKESL